MKRWKQVLTAGTLAVGLLLQSVPALASDEVIRNGSFHIDQFGEYDILAAVTVDDDRIADVEITGENFGGTYAEVNKKKLSQAAEGITEKLKGLSTSDAGKIMAVDVVSGATRSSNGIKGAVLNALNLKEEEEKPGSLEKTLEAGDYTVQVSVKSDVVEHSLVETETAAAKLHVDADGKVQLSYRMVSGTEKEPMYVLEFNGYYPDNDKTKQLTMEGATVKKEAAKEYTIATDVAFPLCDQSGTYYVNSKIYVPAMSNLNGQISGVMFENGTFNVDNTVTVYWDTLKNGDGVSTKNMEISATVNQTVDTPVYSVIIPAAVSMGSVSRAKDNTMPYELKVRSSEKNIAVTVSAPGEGQLLKADTQRSKAESLKFTNDFGTQTVRTDTAQQADGSGEYNMKGNIHIAAADVENAAAGSYSGTTVFTITYKNAEENPDTDPDKPSDDKKDDQPDNTPDNKPDNNPDTTPDDKSDDTPAPTPSLDRKHLADGVYSLTGTMVKNDKTTYSMSNDAINHTIKLTVKDGKYYLTVNLHGLTVGQKMGYLSRLKYFTTGYTLDQYGNPKGDLKDVTVDSYQKNADGTLVSDTYGTDYPDVVTFEMIPEALEDGYVPLQVFVPIMESVAAGAGTQPVFLKLDWSSLKATTADDENFTKDDSNNNNNNNSNTNNSTSNGSSNGSSLGNNTLGNNTLKKSSLGNSKLGTSSLGSGSSLKKSGLSSLKSAASAKTGDIAQHTVLWIAVLLLGGAALITGLVVYRKKKKE